MKIAQLIILLLASSLFASKDSDIKLPSVQETPFGYNLKYFGITYHPGGGSAGDTPYLLQVDKEGYFVVQIGAEADLDYYLNDYFMLRSTVALFKDCAFVWSGHYHFGFRGNYTFDNGFSMRFGIGPTIIWRENWWEEESVNDWYNGDGFYGKERQKGPFQTAFLWYGGNLEFDYQLNDDFAFVYSMIPGYPQVFTSSFGLRGRF